MITVNYKIPVFGLGTDFSDYERPITYATTYTNRFRNITGGAERRPGINTLAQVSGGPALTRMHEYISNTGSTTLFASDDYGSLWTVSSGGGNTPVLNGKAQTRMLSAQAEDKLIFVNGEDRNFYTADGGQTFDELRAVITRGKLGAGSNATTLTDSDITNWLSETNVANNDIIYNTTKGVYGIVTVVASSAITHTTMGTGGGALGAGAAVSAGDSYILMDYVDMNIINQGDGTYDNLAVIGTSNDNYFSVSGVDFSQTEARKYDIVYNTTRGAITYINTVSANISVSPGIGGMTAGDTVVLFKSAMPIASWVHVHYGRAYYLDSRNKTQIIISAPDDPEDVTTYQKTLDSTSFSFGSQQPVGDALQSMSTFQKYFVASGEKNLYIYDGISPIADTSASTQDFKPIAYYPNGIATRFGLGTNGSDLLHITTEGLQAINIGNISNTTVQNNASVPIRTTMLNAILATPPDDIQLTFYPRRSWLINKVGDVCYILNTNPTYSDGGQLQVVSSWHLFTGPWAQLNHYFVRHNGDLIGCGGNGGIYYLDNGAPTDNGQKIPTDLQTAWLTLEEPQKSIRVKTGRYIKPVFESVNGLEYTVNAVAGWDNFSSDSIAITVTGPGQIGQAIIGTTPIGNGNTSQADKYPLQWRGEQVTVEFTTESSASPDILTGFTLYGDIGGIR